MEYGRERQWRYLECRGNDDGWAGSSPSLSFYSHVVELAGGQEGLFARLGGALRRGIRKAEKAALQIEFGSNLDSMETFYALHCATRQRHGVPPQPFRFFENISQHVLRSGHGLVAIARSKGRSVAAGVFFHHAKEAFYKFGASDYQFQHLRPNNLLMWEVIKRYAAHGYISLDLGRTSLVNEGLRRFKLGFGSRENLVEYFKYDFGRQQFVLGADRAQGWANRVFRCFPVPLLRLMGRAVYPHLS
jgi:lipid II:glycine glycyltransferase (peptidoglycan interpeptide bridge formation enzyme)